MRLATRIAPHDQIDWARAMQSELDHVEGDWAALRWALGGATVLVRHAFLRAITPGSTRNPAAIGGGVFTKEGHIVRKTTLAAVGVCAVATFLFFLAPAFRQAFRVSMAEWEIVFGSQHYEIQPDFGELTRRAEQQHDPEGLAFVAIHTEDDSESARLAEEAVRLDPNLTWVYAAVAVNHPELPEIGGWIPRLEQSDPQNALPYLITAESADINQLGHAAAVHGKLPTRAEEQSPAWRDALAAAFQSEKLDAYLDRLTALDRRVLDRYTVNDPYLAMRNINGRFWYGLPSYAAGDASRYADWLVRSGGMLEAQTDRKGAREKYLAVARFANILNWPGGFPISRSLQDSYTQLAALSRQEGNTEQADLYVALAANSDRERDEARTLVRQRWAGGAVAQWNAAVVKAAGLMMLFSTALALICIASVVAKSRSLRLPSLRAGRAASTILVGSFSGLLFSSAMLYVNYRPYAEMFRSYIRGGDSSRVQEFTDFLYLTQIPLGASNVNDVSNFIFRIWLGIVVLCVLALFFVTLSYISFIRESIRRCRSGTDRDELWLCAAIMMADGRRTRFCIALGARCLPCCTRNSRCGARGQFR